MFEKCSSNQKGTRWGQPAAIQGKRPKAVLVSLAISGSESGEQSSS